jgi:hypothetical protein
VLFKFLINRAYSRQFLQTGSSPAFALSVIDIISPSQNFLLSQDNASAHHVKEPVEGQSPATPTREKQVSI